MSRIRCGSYGHRNQFGLALRSGTKQLFQTENGHQCNDELNLIVRGGGIVEEEYLWREAAPEEPFGRLVMAWRAIVTTDLWWYDGRIADGCDFAIDGGVGPRPCSPIRAE